MLAQDVAGCEFPGLQALRTFSGMSLLRFRAIWGFRVKGPEVKV